MVALTLSAQERVFRLARRDYDLTLVVIAREANVPFESLRNYAGHKGERQMMPVSVLNKLCGVIPDELLSQLVEPGGRLLLVDQTLADDREAA